MSTITTELSYKYKFISEPPDSLKCLICLDIAEEPWQHAKCGRLFCKKCIEDYGKTKLCPFCRNKKPQYFEDNKSRREINDLPVRCMHANRKCEWKGTIGTLEEHLATCFVLFPCPNQCRDEAGNIRGFLKKELDEHLMSNCPNRDHACENCGEKGTYVKITRVHDRVCPRKKLECSNDGCSCIILRQDMKNHLQTECDHAIISCKYRYAGCTVSMKRHKMADHEDSEDKHHLHIALQMLSLEKSTMKNGRPMTFKLADYQKKKESNTSFMFPAFYSHPNGYCMAIEVYANGSGGTTGSHASVYVPILEGKHSKDLEWPFVGKITIALLNQLENRNHYEKTLDIELEDNARVGDDWGYRMFISHHDVNYCDTTRNVQYLKDDTLYFRVMVQVACHKPWLEVTQ